MEALIRRLELAAAVIAGICVVAMMLIVSADAVMRYLLHAPIPWAFDLVSSYLLLTATYLALSETFRRGDHISITLFQLMMPPRARAIFGAVSALLAAAVFVVIGYGYFNNASMALAKGEYLPGYIQWPVWLSYVPIAAGSALITLRLLHHAIVLLIAGHDPSVALEGESIE